MFMQASQGVCFVLLCVCHPVVHQSTGHDGMLWFKVTLVVGLS